MKKIFLDIGAYNGVSAEFFLANHPQAKEFLIYSFECDSRNIEILKNKQLPINLIEKAAWVTDGFVRYYYGMSDGGTLYSTKRTGNINVDVYSEVPAIDIAKFIMDNFTKDDYIIIKMNCEGAEYDIIPHLQKHGLISWIDRWYIQWHWYKIGLDAEEHNKVCYMLPRWYEWDCQFHANEFKDKFKRSL